MRNQTPGQKEDGKGNRTGGGEGRPVEVKLPTALILSEARMRRRRAGMTELDVQHPEEFPLRQQTTQDPPHCLPNTLPSKWSPEGPATLLEGAAEV